MKDGLVLIRKCFTDISTIGQLYLDGDFVCDTLEDTCRREKVLGKTAIPAGRYEVIINDSQRFKRRMPLLLNVPLFQGVRIHYGNDAAATDGCILVGEKDQSKDNWISHSRDTFENVFKQIEKALFKDRLWIEVYGGITVKDFALAKR